MNGPKPKLVCFSCNFGWGYLSETQALSRQVKYWIRVVCSGKIDAIHILTAFKKGADGVLILGCPDGNCHFQDGNYRTAKRVHLIQNTIKAFGIHPERLQVLLSSDPDGRKIPQLISEMEEKIRGLGPLEI